ncbi:MAG TPA: response regulator [Candidatus Solibacter sp.]|nr:response regulator [Candidatus Solibacter sp.]
MPFGPDLLRFNNSAIYHIGVLRAPLHVPDMEECKNILVVDDEAAIRILLCHALQRSGFQAFEASNGPEAISVARDSSNQIGVLVSDVVMPGMSGPELARNLGAAHPGLKVILMSGYSDNPPAMEPGWEFLQKPFSPATLCDALHRVCGLP